MSPDLLCIWQLYVYVYCPCRIPAPLRCTQCSILFHLVDICFIPCIYVWQILKIQTCLSGVVGPGSTWPACTKQQKIGPSLLKAGGFDTICTAVCNRGDRSNACRLCHLEYAILAIGLLVTE